MPRKRKSRGRAKGGKGHSRMVICSSCGASVPRDKAKKLFRWTTYVEGRIAQELKRKGAYVPRMQVVRYYCISCSIHKKFYSPRREEIRRKPFKKVG